MTKGQINIAIAEYFGWTFSSFYEEDPTLPYYQKFKEDTTCWWVRPGNDSWQREQIPNYCGDLNVIHEARSTLTEKQLADYCQFLISIVRRASGIPDHESHYPVPFVLSATASQHTEAFLRAIGKWQE